MIKYGWLDSQIQFKHTIHQSRYKIHVIDDPWLNQYRDEMKMWTEDQIWSLIQVKKWLGSKPNPEPGDQSRKYEHHIQKYKISNKETE